MLILIIGGIPFYFKPELVEVRSNNKAIFQGKIAKSFKIFQKEANKSNRLLELVENREHHELRQAPGWGTVSLLIDENDLIDKEIGIITHSNQRGPLWERPAFFSYFENGEELISSYVGLRLHGGKSRRSDYHYNNSYRIYLRKRYGENQMPENFSIGNNKLELERLVLHRDEPPEKKFINDFAYFLTRFFGGDAPETKPVLTFINGQFKGYYYIVEHLSRKHLETKFKTKDLIYFRLKSDNDQQDRIELKKILTYFIHAPKPISLAEVSKFLDIESYISSVFPIIFLGTTDYDQGVIYRLNDKIDKRWKYINWDMDHSFYDLKSQAPINEEWKKEALDLLLVRDGSTLRSKVFRRLFLESPEFKKLFLEYSFEQLKKLKPKIWQERLQYYRQLAEVEKIDIEKHLRFLDNWLAKRIEFVTQDLLKYN